MLSNKNARIVAFNFRGGTQTNDSVAIALLSAGMLVYYFDLNHIITDLVETWKKNLNECAFRVTNVTDDTIILDYYLHYVGPENLNFRVVAYVLADGRLKVAEKDIQKLPR